jgi:hypothetical protein
VSELKLLCGSLGLSVNGKKMNFITRILIFIKDKVNLPQPQYPKVSTGNAKTTILSVDSLMVKGEYKNNLKTRLFFKQIIGDHFHFTASGIDWLEHRWMAGLPPTYKEFADIWVKEYEFRKLYGRVPKAEWAYINFVQKYLKDNLKSTRSQILAAWDCERKKHKDLVNKYIASMGY